MVQDQENKHRIAYQPTDYTYLDTLTDVKGTTFENFDLSAFKDLGFQGSKLYQAYMILSYALKNNYTVVLAFTSNVSSCGLRDIVAQLCKQKLVDVIVTTCGGIEEDIIKTKFPFKLLNKRISDATLYSMGINRTENVLVSNSSYVWFEDFLTSCVKKHPVLESTTPVQLVKTLSKELDPQDSTSSYLYWAHVNGIQVIPLGLEDGAIGDFYACQNYNRIANGLRSYSLNCADTLSSYLEYHLKQPQKKICVWVLGGNLPKHFAMNGLIPLRGADLGVYLNNEPILQGSNEGADLNEAISWGKAKASGTFVKVCGDFIFTFPMLASALLKDKRNSY